MKKLSGPETIESPAVFMFKWNSENDVSIGGSAYLVASRQTDVLPWMTSESMQRDALRAFTDKGSAGVLKFGSPLLPEHYGLGHVDHIAHTWGEAQ